MSYEVSTKQRPLPFTQKVKQAIKPLLRLHTTDRKLLLLGVDIFLLNGALILSLLLRTDLLSAESAILANIKWFVTLTLYWGAVATVFDLYNLARSASSAYTLKAVMPAILVTCLAYLATPWLTPPLESRLQTYLFILFALASVPSWRLLYVRLFHQPTFHSRALVVGSGQHIQKLVEALQSDYARQDANPFRGTGYTLVGLVPDKTDYHLHDMDVPILGDYTQLASIAGKKHINEIIVALNKKHPRQPDVLEAILDCREQGLPVINIETVYERLTGRVSVQHEVWNVENIIGYQEGAYLHLFLFIKRAIDLLGGFVGLLGLLLLIPFVMLANVFLSPGPLFFRQKRVGLSGKPFMVIKFRSMIPNAEKGRGAVWANKNDSRVTRVGQFLRRTHLDELPQVLNILKGEMSIVGPRPERPEFVSHLAPHIPLYRLRHSVKPGLTGWAQIHQDYGDSIESSAEKLEYDLYYIKHASPILDVLVILRTVAKVIGLQGR